VKDRRPCEEATTPWGHREAQVFSTVETPVGRQVWDSLLRSLTNLETWVGWVGWVGENRPEAP
jgi:hypothetical protein